MVMEPSPELHSYVHRKLLPFLLQHCAGGQDYIATTEEAAFQLLSEHEDIDLQSHPDTFGITDQHVLNKCLELQRRLAIRLTGVPHDGGEEVFVSVDPRNPRIRLGSTIRWAEQVAQRGNQLRLTRLAAEKVKAVLGQLVTETKRATRLDPWHGPLKCSLDASYVSHLPPPLLSREAIHATPFKTTPAKCGQRISRVGSGPLNHQLKTLAGDTNVPVPEIQDPVLDVDAACGGKLKLSRTQALDLQQAVGDLGAIMKQSKKNQTINGIPMHPTLFITIPDIEAVESLRVPVPFLFRDDSLSLTTDHATMFDLFDSQATKLPVSESGLDLTDPYQSKNIQALDTFCLGSPGIEPLPPSGGMDNPFSESSTLWSDFTSEPRPNDLEQVACGVLSAPAKMLHERSSSPEYQSVPFMKHTLPVEMGWGLTLPSPLSISSDFTVGISDAFHDQEEQLSDGALSEWSIAPSSRPSKRNDLFRLVKKVLPEQGTLYKTRPTVSKPKRLADGRRLEVPKLKDEGALALHGKRQMQCRSLEALVARHQELSKTFDRASGLRDLGFSLGWRPLQEALLPKKDSDTFAKIPFNDLSNWSTELSSDQASCTSKLCLEPPMADACSGMELPLLKRQVQALNPNEDHSEMGQRLYPDTTSIQPTGPQAKRAKTQELDKASGQELDKMALQFRPGVDDQTSRESACWNVDTDMHILNEKRGQVLEQPGVQKCQAKPTSLPIEQPQNDAFWETALKNIENSGDGLPPLHCLTVVSAFADRTLCFGLTRANVHLAERQDLEADLVISPRTAIVFQQLGALPSDGPQLSSYLGGLSRYYQRVVVILIMYPGRRTTMLEATVAANPWSPSVIEAWNKLRQATRRSHAVMVATSELAEAMDTQFEFVSSRDAEMTGRLVRICAQRDQEWYGHTLGKDIAAGIFKDREYLSWDVDPLIDQLARDCGINSYCIALINASWPTNKLLEATLVEIQEAFAPIIMPRLLMSLYESVQSYLNSRDSAALHSSNSVACLESATTATTRHEQASYGATSPYAAYGHTGQLLEYNRESAFEASIHPDSDALPGEFFH